MAVGCRNSCHSTRENWRQSSALPNSLIFSQPRVPHHFESEMGKGEAGELCALPHALRMTLLFIYSTWDHWAWAVVFPVPLENIHHHLIWFKQTEFSFIKCISLKASVKPTLKVKFFRAGTVPAQTGKLELNPSAWFHGAGTNVMVVLRKVHLPLWFCITLFFLGAFSSTTYGKKNINSQQDDS